MMTDAPRAANRFARRLAGTLALLFALAACSPPQPAPVSDTLADSLFAAAPSQRWALPLRLREISGLAVSLDGRLFGHDDEAAVIYEIDARTGRLVKAFALGGRVEAGDFEGLAITPEGEFWLTTSHGRLYRFHEGEDGEHVAFEQLDTDLAQICEVEGLAYLAAEESLILACKHNEGAEMRGTVALRAWTLGDVHTRPWRNLPEAEIAAIAGVRHFRPSALDVDARTGRLLLLSANDGALAELGPDGALISARRLQGHPQAEGLAVLADGALAIADEAGNEGLIARLSIYPRTNP